MPVPIILLGGAVALFLLTVFFGAPYVPSKRRDIMAAFDELYQLKSQDRVVDIGSGDGVVCRAASLRGARALGIEINPILVAIAMMIDRKNPLVKYRLGHYASMKLPPDTSLVYVFGESRHIMQLMRYVEQQATHLDKTLYLMSYAFELEGRVPLRRNKTHFLYEITPLQSEKA